MQVAAPVLGEQAAVPDLHVSSGSEETGRLEKEKERGRESADLCLSDDDPASNPCSPLSSNRWHPHVKGARYMFMRGIQPFLSRYGASDCTQLTPACALCVLSIDCAVKRDRDHFLIQSHPHTHAENQIDSTLGEAYSRMTETFLGHSSRALGTLSANAENIVESMRSFSEGRASQRVVFEHDE